MLDSQKNSKIYFTRKYEFVKKLPMKGDRDLQNYFKQKQPTLKITFIASGTNNACQAVLVNIERETKKAVKLRKQYNTDIDGFEVA